MLLMNLLVGFKLGAVKNKGNMEPKGRRRGYLEANRRMKDSIVSFSIVQRYFRPFSVQLTQQHKLFMISQCFLRSTKMAISKT